MGACGVSCPCCATRRFYHFAPTGSARFGHGGPATISKRNSRQSIFPLKSGVFFDGFNPISLAEPQVAREEAGGPAGEALLQRIAESRVERRERRIVAQAKAVRRIRDQDAVRGRRRARAARRPARSRSSRRPRPSPHCRGNARARPRRYRLQIFQSPPVRGARDRARAGAAAATSARRTSGASGSRTSARVRARGRRRSAQPRSRSCRCRTSGRAAARPASTRTARSGRPRDSRAAARPPRRAGSRA